MFCKQTVLGKLRGKPTASSWKPEETGAFFIVFYNLTLLIAFIATYYFLNSAMSCYEVNSNDVMFCSVFLCDVSCMHIFQQTKQIPNHTKQKKKQTISTNEQGPFQNVDSPFVALTNWMNQNNLSLALTILSNTSLFMVLAALFELRAALLNNLSEVRLVLPAFFYFCCLFQTE